LSGVQNTCRKYSFLVPIGLPQNCPKTGENSFRGAIWFGSGPATQRSALTVKKVTLSVIALFLTGVGCLVGNAWAKPGEEVRDESAIPHKIGLIDINYLFNHYEKFTMMREELKAEAEEAEKTMRSEVERLQSMQRQLKDFDSGSKEFLGKEREITELQVKLQSEQKLLQGQFLRKEAKIHQTVYQEVSDMVEKFCTSKKYTLILKFNREEMNGDDPREVQFVLQKQVVFSRPEDDITETVLKVMNNKYQGGSKSDVKEKPSPPRPNNNSTKSKAK
jgi:Skp family chaperone for outer membrane proteins